MVIHMIISTEILNSLSFQHLHFHVHFCTLNTLLRYVSNKVGLNDIGIGVDISPSVLRSTKD